MPNHIAVSAVVPFLLALCVCPSLYAACDKTAQIDEVRPGVFVRHGKFGAVFEQDELANIGFIVGDQCIAVIDTGGSAVEGNSLQCAIKEVSNLPVCYVVNTHVHPDHTLGNQAFDGEETEFIGHKNLPRAFAILGDTYLERARALEQSDNSRIVVPTTIVEDTLDLDLGNRQILIRTSSQAHTDNDVTVFDISTGTLWAGDLLFAGHVPVIGGSGSINGWISAQSELGDDSIKLVIPGHGPVSSNWREAIRSQTAYLVSLRQSVRDWIEKGGDIGPAVETLGQSEGGKWRMFDHFHKRNVSYAYTELEWE